MSYVAVNAGEMIDRVTFSVATDSEDAQLTSITTWSTSGQTAHPAKVEPMSGREFMFGDRIAADCDTAITMWYDSITSARSVKDRIVFGSKTFAIQSIVNVENRNVKLVFACKELVL